MDDDDMRKALNERMDRTLTRYEEPWQEAVENQDVKERYYTKRMVPLT